MSQSNYRSKSGDEDYERPNQRYRCGRGAAWGKPCAVGPTPDGRCGDTDCPTGKDSLPPCVPRLTLRARRGRMTWHACALILLLIAAGFHFGRGAKSKPLMVDPGPLSAKHASFTSSRGCAACHPAHDAGLRGFLAAAFRDNDMSGQCLKCHTFSGGDRSPHNETLVMPDGSHETDCRMCHTEHHGTQAKIATLTEEQCHSCHTVKFQRFDNGHPVFPSNFPRVERFGIKFNHAKHLQEYFKQHEYSGKAPQACIRCHAASARERAVRTLGFDIACASCHAEQIPQNDLVLLRLPEPTTNVIKLTTEDATTFMAWVLQRGGATNYGVALQQFMVAAAKDGIAPLAKEVRTDWPTTRGDALLTGLNPELLLRPAQLWTNGQKFDPPSGKVQNGWYWLEDLYPELRYKPAGHADSLARAWTWFALNLRNGTSGDSDRKRAGDFGDEVTQLRTSVGRCVKCHAVSSVGKGMRDADWNYHPLREQPHTRFSHGAHLGLRQCEDCHTLNPQADYESQFKVVDLRSTPGVSNFKSIALANCTGCHAENKVRNDCALCHQYHRESFLREIAVSK